MVTLLRVQFVVFVSVCLDGGGGGTAMKLDHLDPRFLDLDQYLSFDDKGSLPSKK